MFYVQFYDLRSQEYDSYPEVTFNTEMTSRLSSPRHAIRHATGCDL